MSGVTDSISSVLPVCINPFGPVQLTTVPGASSTVSKAVSPSQSCSSPSIKGTDGWKLNVTVDVVEAELHVPPTVYVKVYVPVIAPSDDHVFAVMDPGASVVHVPPASNGGVNSENNSTSGVPQKVWAVAIPGFGISGDGIV